MDRKIVFGAHVKICIIISLMSPIILYDRNAINFGIVNGEDIDILRLHEISFLWRQSIETCPYELKDKSGKYK